MAIWQVGQAGRVASIKCILCHGHCQCVKGQGPDYGEWHWLGRRLLTPHSATKHTWWAQLWNHVEFLMPFYPSLELAPLHYHQSSSANLFIHLSFMWNINSWLMFQGLCKYLLHNLICLKKFFPTEVQLHRGYVLYHSMMTAAKKTINWGFRGFFTQRNDTYLRRQAHQSPWSSRDTLRAYTQMPYLPYRYIW